MMPDRPIRVVAVSYLNTFPFLFGIRQSPELLETIELRLEMPSECARLMMSGEVDLGLMPVAAIPAVKDARVVSDFCIGADGRVDSVCLFSEVPLSEVTEILLDYQSRTSVQLVRVLADRHFHIRPKWTPAGEDFIDGIGGTTAGVVIGDRAFPLLDRFPVVMDLSEEWKAMTGLPFVFACWVANRELPDDFLQAFNTALRYGVEHRTESILERNLPDAAEMVHYVNHRISYALDEQKRQALRLFLQFSAQL